MAAIYEMGYTSHKNPSRMEVKILSGVFFKRSSIFCTVVAFTELNEKDWFEIGLQIDAFGVKSDFLF